uniref:T. congolense-specific, cell surface-expressed gene family n=1 Tax=Trypanosoma congolense (strain IL3000) TaxID=1068625 RepID=G0UR86_TRYCI|nr:hypothetical protein, unlikely [Trypanosoma congolense IL3000]
MAVWLCLSQYLAHLFIWPRLCIPPVSCICLAPSVLNTTDQKGGFSSPLFFFVFFSLKYPNNSRENAILL